MSHGQGSKAEVFHLKCERAAYGWCIEPRGDHVSQWQRSSRLRRNRVYGADPSQLGSPWGGREGTKSSSWLHRQTTASDQALERENRASFARPMRFCASLKRICPGGADQPVQAMIGFIDDYRGAYGSSRSAVC